MEIFSFCAIACEVVVTARSIALGVRLKLWLNIFKLAIFVFFLYAFYHRLIVLYSIVLLPCICNVVDFLFCAIYFF